MSPGETDQKRDRDSHPTTTYPIVARAIAKAECAREQKYLAYNWLKNTTVYISVKNTIA